MQINAEQLNYFFGGGGASLLQHQNIIKMLFFFWFILSNDIRKKKSHTTPIIVKLVKMNPQLYIICVIINWLKELSRREKNTWKHDTSILMAFLNQKAQQSADQLGPER